MSKIRIKFRQMPGDINKRAKIRMLESKEGFQYWPWQFITEGQIRTYRQVIRSRERAVFKRRTDKAIEEQRDG